MKCSFKDKVKINVNNSTWWTTVLWENLVLKHNHTVEILSSTMKKRMIMRSILNYTWVDYRIGLTVEDIIIFQSHYITNSTYYNCHTTKPLRLLSHNFNDTCTRHYVKLIKNTMLSRTHYNQLSIVFKEFSQSFSFQTQ